MNEITIDYIDGFMRAVSCGCHGCDYVPFYGVDSFEHTADTIKNSLENHFGLKSTPKWNSPNWPRIENYTLIEADNWKTKLNELLEKWVHSKSKFDSEFIESYKDDLFDQIFEVVGSSPDCFYANIEHEDFEYDNETIGFVGKGNAFYMHFSFSD